MPSQPDLMKIRNSVETVGRLSDSLFRLGPLRIGVDGIFGWVPAVGEIYSAAAAGFILIQGVRAGVSAGTLAVCVALMGGRTLMGAVPLAGPLAVDLFTAHRWSARLVVAAIDRKLAAAGSARPTPRWRSMSPARFGFV